MTITETQAQSPLFPLLPSVQILFAAFFLAMFEAVRAAQQYRPRIGRHTGISRCIWLRQLNLEDDDDWRTGERRGPYRMTVKETQPQSPLFPLLPSVQILFAAFC